MIEATGQPQFICPHCGGAIATAAGSSGTIPCPTCQQSVSVLEFTPVPTVNLSTSNATASHQPGSLCAICQSAIAGAEPQTSCPSCNAVYHADCWAENGGCAIYGCTEVPKTDGRKAVEIPMGYWGQEKKPCPVCTREILAAAIRCVHCGSVFKTARPLDNNEFGKSIALEVQGPRLRRKILWFFIACLVPLTAPVAIIVLFFWHQSRREEIENLPSLYPAMVKIGLLVGLIETIAITLLTMAFTLLHH